MTIRRRPSLQVAVAIIERRGRVLVCRRRSRDDFDGYWEFPGGKRLPGEAWVACLRREAAEELGVRLRDIRLIGRLQHLYPSRRVTFRLFRCAIAAGRPTPYSATALRWVAPSGLGRLRFPPANRRFLPGVVAALRDAPPRATMPLLLRRTIRRRP